MNSRRRGMVEEDDLELLQKRGSHSRKERFQVSANASE
jgi:hypothetical protein